MWVTRDPDFVQFLGQVTVDNFSTTAAKFPDALSGGYPLRVAYAAPAMRSLAEAEPQPNKVSMSAQGKGREKR